MKNLLEYGFVTSDGCVVRDADGSYILAAQRKPIGEKFFGENPCYAFTSSGEFEFEEYVVIEYSAFGIKRPEDKLVAPFMTARRGEETAELFCLHDVTLDGKKHSIAVRAPEGRFDEIKAEYFFDKVLEANLTIFSLYTCKKSELPVVGKTDDVKGRLTPVDISALFDKKYDLDAAESIVDSGRFPEGGNVNLYGIPFNFAKDGNNLVSPPAPPKENDDIIENFGAKVKRRYARPVSRDSETDIAIGMKASEIFFVLALSGKRYIRCRYGSNPVILGAEYIEIFEPVKVTDTEFFMVEVVYKDGTRDTHLPLNIQTQRHGIHGDISVYGVPCSGHKVEKIVVHNRLLDTDVNIAAVTVNETAERLYPEMLIPEKKEKIERGVLGDKELILDGTRLTLKNGALEMSLELSGGMKLLSVNNAFTPNLRVVPGAFIKLRDVDGNIDENFDFQNVQYYGNYAKITYKYNGIVFDITADISGENNVRWTLEVVNMTDEQFRKGIIFPCVDCLDFGSFDENWYYIPKYQNICSNETIFMYEESAPSFPLQFMDVFSPDAQGGLCLSTEERELVTRKYALSKDDDGVEFYVEYPVMYGDINPHGCFVASPTVLTAHEGDWRRAFGIYKKWLDSWYTPYKCQDKMWYRKCFWLLAEITDFYETMEMCKFPCWYTPETKEFNFRKILEEQKGIAGVYPDILHMWSWCFTWRGDEYGQRWGNYSEEDYAQYGGREAFRNALHDIRDNMGVQVSLYMHPTLLSNSYDKYNLFKDKSLVVNGSGGNICICNDSYRMCHAEESFRESSLAMYPRVYKELGIPLLYVDEFSLRIENRCYAKNHGHHVPSSLLKTDREYISRLKDIMPEEVVLYGEYAAADVNARYIDCNISYYILDSIVDMVETMTRANDGDDRLGRVFMHAYRFAFPKIVQLILPMAMRNVSWHPQKFMFFNGEAVYDSFWDNEESRGMNFNVKAFKLKKKYDDCFSSDNPEMMVETESEAICMNKFPSETRTLYTVYNRAYSTYRGNVLKVPHSEGNTYYDAWNEKELDVKIQDGFAIISLEIDAQQMGCIVVEKKA